MTTKKIDPPAYNKDKDFDHQSVEYLTWCLDQADERVLKYNSELAFHIRKARSALMYRKASEGTVKHLEGLVEQAMQREAEEADAV